MLNYKDMEEEKKEVAQSEDVIANEVENAVEQDVPQVEKSEETPEETTEKEKKEETPFSRIAEKRGRWKTVLGMK